MTIIAPKSLAVIKIHGMIINNGDYDVLLFSDMYKLFMAIYKTCGHNCCALSHPVCYDNEQYLEICFVQ